VAIHPCTPTQACPAAHASVIGPNESRAGDGGAALVIKPEVRAPRLTRRGSSAPKTIVGGKRITAGAAVLIFAHETQNGPGSIARAVVSAAATTAKTRSNPRQTPRARVVIDGMPVRVGEPAPRTGLAHAHIVPKIQTPCMRAKHWENRLESVTGLSSLPTLFREEPSFDWRARAAKRHPWGQVPAEPFALACETLNQIIEIEA
jgi:hypothetical protein